jgi:hypothetical protein
MVGAGHLRLGAIGFADQQEYGWFDLLRNPIHEMNLTCVKRARNGGGSLSLDIEKNSASIAFMPLNREELVNLGVSIPGLPPDTVLLE